MSLRPGAIAAPVGAAPVGAAPVGAAPLRPRLEEVLATGVRCGVLKRSDEKVKAKLRKLQTQIDKFYEWFNPEAPPTMGAVQNESGELRDLKKDLDAIEKCHKAVYDEWASDGSPKWKDKVKRIKDAIAAAPCVMNPMQPCY